MIKQYNEFTKKTFVIRYITTEGYSSKRTFRTHEVHEAVQQLFKDPNAHHIMSVNCIDRGGFGSFWEELKRELSGLS